MGKRDRARYRTELRTCGRESRDGREKGKCPGDKNFSLSIHKLAKRIVRKKCV